VELQFHFLTCGSEKERKFNQRFQPLLLKISLGCFHCFPSVISEIRELGFGRETIESQSNISAIQGKEMLSPLQLTSASHCEPFLAI